MADEKHRVPETVANAVRRAEEALQQDKADARRYFKLWMGVLPKKRPKRSNLSVRKIYAFEENAVARDIAAVFQYRPYFDLESRSGKDSQRADNAEKVLQYFLERADFEPKCVPWFKQRRITGIGVAKLSWRKSVRRQKQRMTLDQAMQLDNFALPPDLQAIHVALSPEGRIEIHDGPADAPAMQELVAQGWRMVGLEEAPPEVQRQFGVTVDAPKVLYDGLDFAVIDFEDCFWDPDATTVDEMRYAGHHYGRTYADLVAEKKSGIPYKNLDKVKAYATSFSGQQRIARYQRRSDVGRTNAHEWNEEATLMKISEFWDVQNGKLYAWVSFSQHSQEDGSGIVIREEDFPYWHGELPYHYLPASVIPFEIMGIGIPEVMEHLANERNDLRNIQMDMRVLAITPPLVVDTNKVTDLAPLRNIGPNTIIEVEGGDRPVEEVVHQLRPDGTALQNTEFLIRTIDQDMEEVTGVTKATQGVPIARRTTYSEQSLLVNEANLRFRMDVMLIDTHLKRLARQTVRLLDQFCDPQIEVRITGDDGHPAFMEVDREDLSLEYDIYPQSSSVESLASQMAQAQQIINGYAAIRGSALEAVLKHAPFVREYFRKLGVKDVNQFIKTDDELQKELEANLRAQAQQGQPGQPGQPGQSGQTPDETQQIEQENEALLGGEPVPVTPEQNHALHLQGHEPVRAAVEQSLASRGITEEQAMQEPLVANLLQHLQAHTQMMEGSYGQAGTAGEGAPVEAV